MSRTLARGAADDPASAETATALLRAFGPETPVQAMLAAQAVALHHAAIDCFGRAMQTADEDNAAIARLQRNAASLTRAFTATLHILHRCQVAAAQAAEAAREEAMQPEAARAREEESEAWQNQAGEKEFALSLRAWAATRAKGGGEAPPNGDPSTPTRRGPHSPTQQPWSAQQDPVQREEPAQRPWEELTETEQFAILYPDRVAAGAISHEHAGLWLGKLTRQQQPGSATR